MQTLTATLLLLGVVLAPIGTFIYAYVGLTAPDPETMRLAKQAAVLGRWTGYAGCILAVIHGTSGQLTLAAVALSAAAATATYVTKLPPPKTPRPV